MIKSLKSSSYYRSPSKTWYPSHNYNYWTCQSKSDGNYSRVYFPEHIGDSISRNLTSNLVENCLQLILCSVLQRIISCWKPFPLCEAKFTDESATQERITFYDQVDFDLHFDIRLVPVFPRKQDTQCLGEIGNIMAIGTVCAWSGNTKT